MKGLRTVLRLQRQHNSLVDEIRRFDQEVRELWLKEEDKEVYEEFIRSVVIPELEKRKTLTDEIIKDLKYGKEIIFRSPE